MGQFFTPQEVVNFCVELAEPEPTDVVLDPAVGTARFVVAGMQRMLTRARQFRSPQREEVEEEIKNRKLYGVDLDDWVATIAKMNMYIHGDGMSHMVQGNGLTIMDRGVFDVFPNGIANQIDVVLTNPPLGDTNYLIAREKWADLAKAKPDAPAMAGFLQGLGVVPMREPRATPIERRAHQLQREVKAANAKVAELSAGPASPKRSSQIAKWKQKANAALEGLTTLKAANPSGPTVKIPSGERMKGGAIFLGAIARYLKNERSPSAKAEWRGGKAAIVVDEAILNTPEYSATRRFIREQFFIKAVISLGRPAFKYLAHTDAKTSILFLVKKPNPALEQREPIFFAHAERVGYSATGKWIGTDLPAVLDNYRAVRDAVGSTYRGSSLDTVDALDAAARVSGWADAWHVQRPADDLAGRLDFFNARYHDLVARMDAQGVALRPLGEMIEPAPVDFPPPSTSDTYAFATIERKTATLRSKGDQQTTYRPADLWIVREGDIVVSGIDLVHGAVAVARADVAGMVMSKEMFAYRPKSGVLAEYMALMLRTEVAKTLIHGWITGTSNRTRLATADQLLSIPVPTPPSTAIQKQMVKDFRAAAKSRQDAEASAPPRRRPRPGSGRSR